MVDTRELRIGNYVLIGPFDKRDSAKLPCQIEDIYPLGADSIIVPTKDFVKCSCRFLYPIRIDRELLEKSGFIYSSNHIYEYGDNPNILFDEPENWENVGKYPTGISGIETLFPSYCNSHGEVVIRCLYLHTLQNMFHAITQKELEIDL